MRAGAARASRGLPAGGAAPVSTPSRPARRGRGRPGAPARCSPPSSAEAVRIRETRRTPHRLGAGPGTLRNRFVRGDPRFGRIRAAPDTGVPGTARSPDARVSPAKDGKTVADRCGRAAHVRRTRRSQQERWASTSGCESVSVKWPWPVPAPVAVMDARYAPRAAALRPSCRPRLHPTRLPALAAPPVSGLRPTADRRRTPFPRSALLHASQRLRLREGRSSGGRTRRARLRRRRRAGRAAPPAPRRR